MMYLGIDPGIRGYFVLIDGESNIIKTWKMPLIGGKITPHSVLGTIKEIRQAGLQTMTNITVGVEKLLTLPSDTNKVMLLVDEIDDAMKNNSGIRNNIITDIKKQLKKTDGRVGTLTMGINWGYIVAMCVVCGWTYQVYAPRTWQATMHAGQDKKMPAKARSRIAFTQLWPAQECKHDGLIDAALIAEFTRRKLGTMPS